MGRRLNEVRVENAGSFVPAVMLEAALSIPAEAAKYYQERAELLAESFREATGPEHIEKAREGLRRRAASSRMPLTRLIGRAERQAQDTRAALHNLSARKRSVLARISPTDTSEKVPSLATLREGLVRARSIASA